MKKFLIVVGLFVFLLLGIQLGSDIDNSRNLIIEEAKEQFENEIIKEDNNYQNILLEPEDNVVNSVAKKIDNVINKVMDKLKSFM